MLSKTYVLFRQVELKVLNDEIQNLEFQFQATMKK
jgi:hypothetical protein